MAGKNSNRKSRAQRKTNQSPRWYSNFDNRDGSDKHLLMDLADCNVSKTILFLKVVLKLADVWPKTRRVSEELGQICLAIWRYLDSC